MGNVSKRATHMPGYHRHANKLTADGYYQYFLIHSFFISSSYFSNRSLYQQKYKLQYFMLNE